MSHSLSLYAKCKVNHKLYRVDLKTRIDGQRFTLRPVDGKPYQVIFASAEQLHSADLFQLFPMFRCVVVAVQSHLHRTAGAV